MAWELVARYRVRSHLLRDGEPLATAEGREHVRCRFDSMLNHLEPYAEFVGSVLVNTNESEDARYADPVPPIHFELYCDGSERSATTL